MQSGKSLEVKLLSCVILLYSYIKFYGNQQHFGSQKLGEGDHPV